MDQSAPDGGRYAKEEVFDYPSIGNLLKVISNEEISVIFAVTEDRGSKLFKTRVKAEVGSLYIYTPLIFYTKITFVFSHFRL